MLLRLVRRRALAFAVGVLLAAPAIWAQSVGRVDTWWGQGLSLIAGAVGAALVWTAIAGLKPDWVEDDFG